MKKRIFLLLVTILFLYFICINLDVKELLQIIKRFNLIYIIPSVCSILIFLSLRGLVFKQLLKKTIQPPLIELSHLCITTAAMNILFPARAGDIFRAFYIGNKYRIDKLKILGTVIFERIFDIIVIFSFLLAGIFIYQKNQIAINLCLFAGTFAVVCLIVIWILYKYKKINIITDEKLPIFSKLFQKIIIFIQNSYNSFIKGFEAIESPKELISPLLTSFSIWFFECLNFYIIMTGFNCDIHWSVTLFLIGFIALACMIPSTSIFIGPYQAAVVMAFSIYDINKETALAISIVAQSITVVTTSIMAIIFFIIHNVSYNPEKMSNNMINDKT